MRRGSRLFLGLDGKHAFSWTRRLATLRKHCGFSTFAGLSSNEAALKQRKRRFGGGQDPRGSLGICSRALGVLCLGVVLSTARCDGARAAEPLYDINVPATNATDALNRFAEQTGAILLFPYDLARTRQANAVRGRYTLLEGLQRLLDGTGLSGGLSDKRVVSISQTESARHPGEEGDMLKKKMPVGTKIAAFFASIFSVSAVHGQNTDTQQVETLEEVVVTALRRPELNQKAPATIVAVNSETLVARGIVDAQSLDRVLPGTVLRRQGPSTKIFIRGVGATNDAANFFPAAVLLYNGVILPRFGSFGFTNDLGSVEMIAGPQGTLYGGTAAGGAINISSQRPQFGSAGYASVEGRNFDTYHLTGAQDLTLSDRVGFRASVDYLKRGSYYSNGLFTYDGYTAKLGALLKPTEAVSAYVFFSHGHQGGLSATSSGQNPSVVPGEPWDLPRVGAVGQIIDPSLTKQDNNNNVIGANIDVNVGENHFTYIPAYVSFKVDYTQYLGRRFNLFDVYGTERQHSQELRWDRRFGPLQMSGGLFYLHDNLIQGPDIVHTFVSATRSVPSLLNYTYQTNESSAVFAQGIYSISDRLRFTLGGRVTRDRVDATGTGAEAVPIDFHLARNHTDYKIGVDYDLSDRALIYANLQSGYIPFGYVPDVAGNPEIPRSELTAWSAGSKFRFLNNRLEINTELFYYLYRHFQAVRFINLTAQTTVLNVQRSTIPGIDIAIRARASETLALSLNAVGMKARYKEFRGVGYDFSGNTMVDAPDLILVGGIEKTFPLADGGQISLRADTHYQSGRYTDYINFPITTLQKANSRTDVLIGYERGDRFRVEAFVRNIENTALMSGGGAGATPTTPVSTAWEMPRTYGGSIRFSW